MIFSSTLCCSRCHSLEIQRNGHREHGSKWYRCKACGSYGTVGGKHVYSKAKKQEIVAAYQERMSLRGIERVFGA